MISTLVTPRAIPISKLFIPKLPRRSWPFMRNNRRGSLASLVEKCCDAFLCYGDFESRSKNTCISVSQYAVLGIAIQPSMSGASIKSRNSFPNSEARCAFRPSVLIADWRLGVRVSP